MKGLVILGKIDLPIVKDVICPSCGKNCNKVGLRVNIITKELFPCDDCIEREEAEYMEYLAELEDMRYNLRPTISEALGMDGYPDSELAEMM